MSAGETVTQAEGTSRDYLGIPCLDIADSLEQASTEEITELTITP
jgi:hypothetical protein